MSVYKAINAVQADLVKVGIGKDSKNTQQGYMFRGIDAVYNALSPLLAKHGLCILPRVISRECVERRSAKDTALFYITVGVEFDFVASEDGSKHTVVTYGEAMDSGDKATNKAMSAAYKYACMQAFSIPTEGDNDADSTTHEVKPRTPVSAAMQDVQIEPEVMPILQELAAELVDLVEHQNEPRIAYLKLVDQNLIPDQKLVLWSILAPNSKTRAALKKEAEKEKHEVR
jgi:hypothetical protein